nr:putative protein ycf68 [Ipomoea trifida]
MNSEFALSTNKEAISNATMNLMESSILAQDERWRHASHMQVGREVVFPVADGSWSERMISHTGTETRPRLLREQQWGIFRNGRKPDGAMPRGAAAVIQRMQALSGMIGRKASVGGFLSPPSNPRAQPWTGGGNYQAGEDRWAIREIQCRSNFRSLVDPAVRRTTTAPLFSRIHTSLSVYGQLSLEHRLSSASMGKENGAPNNASSQTKNYEINPFILGDGGIDQELDLAVRRMLGINNSLLGLRPLSHYISAMDVSIYLSLDSKWSRCDDLLHGRGLCSSPGCPAAPGKRIEEVSDYFMHAPLARDIAQLVELRSCNWSLRLRLDV